MAEEEILTLKQISSEAKDKKDAKAYLRKFLNKKEYDGIRKEIVNMIVPKILEKPIAEFRLNYDSMNEGLEPLYYWILDFMRDPPPGGLGLDVFKGEEKAGAGATSAYFGETGQRVSLMQQKASEYLGAINQVVKSIINLMYDLKEFEVRIKNYDDLDSNNEETRKYASQALKGVWMDQVDIKKGRGSINMLAQELSFVTLRDAFFAVEKIEEAEKLDLNTRVKNILGKKLKEYLDWKELSEKEIRRRYNIEKAYLKSQIGTVKLYASWVKPYLKAAQKLKMHEFNTPDIVENFSNMQMELEVFGKKDIKKESVHESYDKFSLDTKIYAVVYVKLTFRAVPNVMQGQGGRHYVQNGRADVEFKCYAMDEKELQALESRELYEDMNLVEEWVGTSLDEIMKEADKYLNQEEIPDVEKILKQKLENPLKGTLKGFSEVLGPLGGIVKKKGRKASGVVYEEVMKAAGSKSENLCFTIYNVYKKTHGMLNV